MKHLSFLPAALLVLVACGNTPRFNPAEAPDVEDFRRMTLNLMAPWEHKVFANLPDAASCRAFIASFWSLRDPDPATEENEFRQLMEERYLEVQQMGEGSLPGWKTDRGRMYLVLGPPDRIETPVGFRESAELKGLIYWIYGAPGAREEILRFTDTEGLGVYHLDTFNSSLSLLARIRELRDSFTFSATSRNPVRPLDVRALLQDRELRLELPWEGLMLNHTSDGSLQLHILVLLRSMQDGSVLLRQTFSPLIAPGDPTQRKNCVVVIPAPALTSPFQVLVRDLNGTASGLTVCKP